MGFFTLLGFSIAILGLVERLSATRSAAGDAAVYMSSIAGLADQKGSVTPATVNTNQRHRLATGLIFTGSRINILVFVRLPVLYRSLSPKARNGCFGLSLFLQSPYHALSQIMKTSQMDLHAISMTTIFVCLKLYFGQKIRRRLCYLKK